MTFREDDRGVSAVVGAVLLLGIIVLLFSIYQATFVPSQNERVEFDHSQTAQNDMLDLRNAILEADSAGRTTFATVELGTRYPTRMIARNPPPAAGTLRTGAPANVTVSDDTGTAVTGLCPGGDPIETRNLTYAPGYSEYGNAPRLVYENTVLYLDFGDRTIPLTDEQLVQGDTVSINPLTTDFQESGVERTSVEPVPGFEVTREVEDGSVTLPTGLDETTWEDLLAGDVDPANVSVTDGNLTIDGTGEIEVSCSPVGLNQAPDGGARTGAGVDINPAGPNDVELRAFARPSNEVVNVTFNNTGTADANVTQARLSFYHNPQDTGGDIGPIDFIDQYGTKVLEMQVLGGTKTLDPVITFPGNKTETTIRFRNQGGEKFSQDDFFIVQFEFSNGREGTYFIDVPQ